MAGHGFCNKIEDLTEGSVKMSLQFPAEAWGSVTPMKKKEVVVMLKEEYEILTKAEVDKANEDTIDSLLRGTDILERLLKVNEEERNALFELLKVYNNEIVDADSADRRGDELMEAQDILLERKMLLGEDEEP